MAASAAGALDGRGIVFPLFGTPFVLIGLAMLSAPYGAWRQSRRTLYVVTDRRALLFSAPGFRAIEVLSFAPEALRSTRRTERPDGDAVTTTVGFQNLADAREAEAAVRALATTAG